MRIFLGIFLFLCVATVSILGIRGTKFTKPPLYVFPDMDDQQKYRPQGENAFFNNQMDDRPLVKGTIARGSSWESPTVFSETFTYDPADNPELYTGKTATGEWVRGFPVEVNHALMELGQKKYTIFCQVCHSAIGDGEGITKQYGVATTLSYHDDRLREMAEGEIFNTITHGKNTMGGYGEKLRPEERWAVIAYLRALQFAQNATLDDVPAPFKKELLESRPATAEQTAPSEASNPAENQESVSSTQEETPSEKSSSPQKDTASTPEEIAPSSEEAPSTQENASSNQKETSSPEDDTSSTQAESTEWAYRSPILLKNLLH